MKNNNIKSKGVTDALKQQLNKAGSTSNIITTLFNTSSMIFFYCPLRENNYSMNQRLYPEIKVVNGNSKSL